MSVENLLKQIIENEPEVKQTSGSEINIDNLVNEFLTKVEKEGIQKTDEEPIEKIIESLLTVRMILDFLNDR